MKRNITSIVLTIIILVLSSVSVLSKPLSLPLKENDSAQSTIQDTLVEFKALLNSLAESSDVPLFKYHCASIIQVIEAELFLSEKDTDYINKMYQAFNGVNTAWNAGDISSYLQRRRPFIIAWISPADSLVSLAWLLPPENWNPDEEYPLYVSLHGAYQPYQNPLEYMALPLIPENYLQRSFGDGYAVFPWGRGNEYYEFIAEIDVWECIDVVENLVKINQQRKYVVGHSMGGFGVLVFTKSRPEVWAAAGIYAGALAYKANKYLDNETALILSGIPFYIVCGEQDDFINMNYFAHNLFKEAGNTNVNFVSYPGDHTPLFEQWEGMYNWIKNFSKEIQTDVNTGEGILPSELILNNNYPNPFNPETIISYHIPSSGFVQLKIYDLLGRELETLVSKEQNAGYYEIKFNADNLTSGIYVYTLSVGSYQITKKMVLLR
ncbi:MAG: T9SS type A sorting domain-containing protein [Ignavibacteriaceae bacterium]